MAEYIRVAGVADVRPGQKKRVWAGQDPVMLANVGGAFYALGDECPHAGSSLAEGRLHGDTIQCPAHGWEFRLKDGRCTWEFIRARARSYDVRVVDGDIEIAVGSREG